MIFSDDVKFPKISWETKVRAWAGKKVLALYYWVTDTTEEDLAKEMYVLHYVKRMDQTRGLWVKK